MHEGWCVFCSGRQEQMSPLNSFWSRQAAGLPLCPGGNKAPLKRMSWGYRPHHRDEKTETPKWGTSFFQNQVLVWNSTLWAVAPLPGFRPWQTAGSRGLGWVVSPLSASVSSSVK